MGSREADNLAFWCLMFVFCIVLYVVYKFLRRISSVDDLKGFTHGEKLTGVVVHVPDGDGFEFIHTPPLRTTVYLPGDVTLPVRLAGIDAPEMPGKHGIPGQPFAQEAKEYLTNLILRKQITIYFHGFDQYGRILAMAHVSQGFMKSTININLDLVEKGLACVYTGRDAIYGDWYSHLLYLEGDAKHRKVGIWSRRNITPMEHKRRYRNQRGLSEYKTYAF